MQLPYVLVQTCNSCHQSYGQASAGAVADIQLEQYADSGEEAAADVVELGGGKAVAHCALAN